MAASLPAHPSISTNILQLTDILQTMVDSHLGLGTHSSAMGRLAPQQPHSHPIHLQPGQEPIAVLWAGLLHGSAMGRFASQQPHSHSIITIIITHNMGHRSAMGRFAPQQPDSHPIHPSIHPSPAGVGTHSIATGRFAPQQPHSQRNLYRPSFSQPVSSLHLAVSNKCNVLAGEQNFSR